MFEGITEGNWSTISGKRVPLKHKWARLIVSVSDSILIQKTLSDFTKDVAEDISISFPNSWSSVYLHVIMCPVDLTGPSKNADKQKANAKASERFRNRKREEAQRELL